MTGRVPATPEQRRLWLIDRHEGGGPAYSIPLAWHVYGELDVSALGSAVDALVARHEALRCAFVDDPDDGVVLEVHDPVPGVLQVRNAPHADAVDLSAFVDQPLSLERGVVFRAALWQLPDEEAVLALVMHHALVDGWSAAILADDLSVLYAQHAAAGAASGLPPAPGLAEIAAWQRTAQTESPLTEALDYWQEALRGAPAGLDLPLDRPRGADLDWGGGIVTRRVDPGVARRLRQVAVENGTTPFVIALAAMGMFLARWCNEEDIVVGVPIADDRDEIAERAVGLFVNTLPIRLDLTGDPSFHEMIRRTQARAFEAMTHRYTPLDALIRSLELDRAAGTHPLFQVMVAYQSLPGIELRLGAARAHARPVFAAGAKFDLLVDLAPRNDTVNVRFEYRTSLFEEPSVVDAAESYVGLLTRCLTSPDTRLSEMDLMPSDVVTALLGSPPAPVDAPRSVLHAMAETVRADPHAIAVSCGEVRLTRRELWQAGTRLAGRLRAADVTDGTLVGSLVPRGVDLLVAMLGIWMAGAVYVPLDAASPASRNLRILDEAGIGVLVAGGPTPDLGRRTVVPPTGTGSSDTEAALPEAVADRPAYVMHTSGSTGGPKGVLIEHHSLAGLIAEMRRLVRPEPGDRMVAATSVTFDISLIELVLPLVAGIECVVADDAAAADPVRLAALVGACGATIVQATPSVWRLLAEHLDIRLRVALCGGEPLSGDVRDALLKLADRPFNVYGPTETTIWSSAWAMTTDAIEIGDPLGNNRFLVLDRWRRPAPPGTWGELWISGPALARGYLNRPELTAEAFVVLPGAGRTYRTGDRARRTRNGRYELGGRVDDQLKLRGYRIEPGEVENAVNALPGVRACAVVAVEIDDNRSLAAVVVPDAADGPQSVIEDWRKQWDGVYSEIDSDEFPGWNSSLSGERYPDEVMREWFRHAVEALDRPGLGRVLEIGAGAGVLARSLAPRASSWLATDISPRSVDLLNRQRERLGADFTALLRPAHNWDGVPGRFDLVILNSVVHYFPDGGYLDAVLNACLDRVEPGGRVFVGDVRSWPLARALYRAMAAARRPEADGRAAETDRLAAAERELLVDPAYFRRLARARGDVRLSLRPKHLGEWSEMSAFRYDVMLTKGAPAVVATPGHREDDWPGPSAYEKLCAQFRDQDPPMVLRGVPHRHNASWLGSDVASRAVTPTWLVETAGSFGRAAVIRVDPADATLMTVYLGSAPATVRRLAEWHAVQVTTEPGPALVSEPRPSSAAGFDPDEALHRLRRTLPGYLVPTAMITVPDLPLLPSGKVDRHRLRRLVVEHLRAAPPVAEHPADPVEAAVRAAWVKILGHDGFGRADSFFRLGGDSLGAVRILADVRRSLGVDLRLPQFIRTPTLAGLCDLITRPDATETTR